MDVNDEECIKKEQEIQELITSFMNSYDEYMKIELVHPTNKEIQELYMLSSNINTLIEQINQKIKTVTEMYENHPRKKFYQNNVKSLQRKKDTIDRLGQKFKDKFDYNSDFISDYVYNNEEKNDENNKITQTTEDNNNQFEQFEDLSKEDYEQSKEKLFVLKEIIDNDENFLGCSKEEMAEIIAIKNQLKDLLAMTREQIEADNEKLLQIEELVEKAAEKVDQGNEELKKAALVKNKNSKMKLQILFGGVLGALGTFANVIPGVGNALGAFLGTRLGKLISKADKKAIENIDKKYNKHKKKK